MFKPMKCSTNRMHHNPRRTRKQSSMNSERIAMKLRELGDTARIATSTKQKAQRQCDSQREGQSGQKIEYSVDCLVGHSCMLYLITDFFWQSILRAKSSRLVAQSAELYPGPSPGTMSLRSTRQATEGLINDSRPKISASVLAVPISLV